MPLKPKPDGFAKHTYAEVAAFAAALNAHPIYPGELMVSDLQEQVLVTEKGPDNQPQVLGVWTDCTDEAGWEPDDQKHSYQATVCGVKCQLLDPIIENFAKLPAVAAWRALFEMAYRPEQIYPGCTQYTTGNKTAQILEAMMAFGPVPAAINFALALKPAGNFQTLK